MSGFYLKSKLFRAFISLEKALIGILEDSWKCKMTMAFPFEASILFEDFNENSFIAKEFLGILCHRVNNANLRSSEKLQRNFSRIAHSTLLSSSYEYWIENFQKYCFTWHREAEKHGIIILTAIYFLCVFVCSSISRIWKLCCYPGDL